ncbi:MAG: pirin family protein [Schleiferiaceae bacterium]
MSSLKYLLPAEKVGMGGMYLDQPFPTQKVQQIDPFLLLHHHNGKAKKGIHPRDQGVGPHPHRGFSPVTFILQGETHHRDSRGNSSIVKAGGVQWLKSGLGVIHSERPSNDMAALGGRSEIIQLWINSRAANKMDEPEYQALSSEEIPTISESGVSTQVIAGLFQGNKGPIKTDFPTTALMVEFTEDGEFTGELPAGWNGFIYPIYGDLQFSGFGLVDKKAAGVLREGVFSFSSKAGNKVLIMMGEPTDEKVTQHGPFVMNTQTEVLEAMRDYQMGKMGFLVEEFEPFEG